MFVFWFLIVLLLILAWFLMFYLFKPLGIILLSLWQSAKDEIIGEEGEENGND